MDPGPHPWSGKRRSYETADGQKFGRNPLCSAALKSNADGDRASNRDTLASF
jgi:hypothetical protein